MYPYKFKPEQPGIRHTEIFVAMPFDSKYNAIYENLICPAAVEANKTLELPEKQHLKPFITKDDIRTTSGWINVLEHLIPARIVIGVLTSPHNGNVFYELGIAHALQPISRQILIAEEGYERTFDTKDLIYYNYDQDDLKGSIVPLSKRIVDAYRTYKIEEERIIRQYRRALTPYALEVCMIHGKNRNFAIAQDAAGRAKYEDEFGCGAYDRYIKGLDLLCRRALVGLNHKTLRSDDSGVLMENSYYWTSLGNDVLHFLEIIDGTVLMKRREEMPPLF